MPLHVVYSDAICAPAQGYSPSAAKPAAVMAAWRARWPGLDVRTPVPATRDDFYRAHARHYVDDVLDCRMPNGFGTRAPEVSASLAYTTGALLTAARWALADGVAVAAPVSGFHHAHWDQGHGFCTFNGLLVTALALQAERPGLKVGILDYDYHYGDGTAQIIARLNVRDVVHITAGAEWTDPQQADAFLANIASDLNQLAGCDVVLYQAGADPHIDDPLGGFLTTAQLAQRDWLVFSGLVERGIPVAWDLAGGYQRPLSKVITIHENSFRASLNAGTICRPTTRGWMDTAQQPDVTPYDLILELGAEGGSLHLMATRQSPPMYAAFLEDQTLTYIDEGDVIHRQSSWGTWQQAISALDKYQWQLLYPRFVDPAHAARIWSLLEPRWDDIREQRRKDWAGLCGHSAD